MAGEPIDPPDGSRRDDLDARVAAAGIDELRRAHRLLLGAEGGYWERNLVTGEVWFSDHFRQMLGLAPATDARGIFGLIHPQDRGEFGRIYRAAIESIGPLHADVRYKRADGGWRWARIQGRVWAGADGSAERVIGMVIDVDAEKQAERGLIEHRQRLQQMVEERTERLEAALAEARRQREQAERANEAKSTFLAHMSHEIRTPLNGLLGLTELALREASGEQQRRYLKLALQSGSSLLDMLNGVLDFSRLNAGATPSRSEPFDLAEVLANAMRLLLPQSREKRLGMMYDYVGPVTRVVGDALALRQIVGNLLSNAIKYTDSGHVALQAEVHPTDQENCVARIEVRDTGPGMTAEVAARIFQPFVQGDESLARRHGGSGLGLSIARGLARSIGGELSVSTVPGSGTCFSLDLPMRMQAGMQPLDQLPDPGLAWLVYTLPTPAEWLAKRLHRLGWHCSIGNMGETLERACRPLAAAERPDLVVLAEAALDSADSLYAVRAALPKVPVVLLVRPDWNQPQIEAAARVNDMPLVFMPLTPGALLELTVRHGRRRAGGADSGFADLPQPVGAGADILIAEDNPVNQLIITEMLGALGMSPRLAVDGAEAVAACIEQAPRLLLMDLQMPVVDGLEAARRLSGMQRAGELPPFPIVALTAHATPQDRANCLAAGMQGYLTKPITLAQLRDELARWLPP
ncbi:ATP-binding protein [Piscinibacter sakaiensis]|uniref:PAS domain-containing hybrid sensor histidine kinase/response regulator n=1 Tax=Piscinibacter sakaiensis TaxID=1547922 RepID=UPI003AAB3E83